MGLVFAHVGQRGDPVDVADRVKPALAESPEGLVDLDRSPVLETDRLEAQVMSSWAPAGGDEKLLGPDRSSVAEGEEDDCAGALALFGPDPQADVDTRLRHRFGELAPGKPLPLAEHARLALDQGGPATRSRRIPGSSRSRRRRPQGRSTDPGCPSRWWPRDWSTARLAPTPGSVGSQRRCRWFLS